jgi:general secretion pathway protein D
MSFVFSPFILTGLCLVGCTSTDALDDAFTNELTELDAGGKRLPVSHASTHSYAPYSSDTSVFQGIRER